MVRARISPFLLIVTIAAAACSGDVAAPTPSASLPSSSLSPSLSPTPSVSPTPPASPAPELPPGIPATYGKDRPAGDLPPDALIPSGADVTGTWYPAADVVLVSYGLGSDPFRREQGLVVWRRFDDEGAPWRATFGFRDPAKDGVLGIEVDTPDVTGDGISDALTFENAGGTGACGTWRVIDLSGDAQTYERALCDATVQPNVDPAGLRVMESIFGPDDPHCCPSGTKTTTLVWNGARWRATSVKVKAAGP